MQAFSGSSFAAPPLADRKEHVIDAMRGFAALLVAYFHCRQVVWVGMQSFHRAYGHALDPSVIVGYLTFPFAWGSAGVPIFFVISGYCIHRNAALKLAADPAYRLDAPNFWARRFARIYPVLLAALLFTLALDAVSLQIEPVSHKIRDIGLAAFLVNLFSLQGVAGYTYGSNGALWTLSLEVQFYAIYPLLFALRRRVGMPAVVAAVAAVNVASAWLLERHDLQFFTSYWLSWTIGAWIADVRARRRAGRGGRAAGRRLRRVPLRSIRRVPAVGGRLRVLPVPRARVPAATDAAAARARLVRRLQLFAVPDPPAAVRVSRIGAVPLGTAVVDLAVVRVHGRRDSGRVSVLPAVRTPGDDVVGEPEADAHDPRRRAGA